MGFLESLIANKIIQSVVVAFIVTGIIKVIFDFIANEKLNLKIFFSTGGMPSSHTATVGAMTASIYFSEGFSNLFVVCAIVSMVIISDAVGIRRAAGKQAQVLNSMIEDFTVLRKFKTKRLYELLGHTPKQVIIGLILGILVAKLVHG